MHLSLCLWDIFFNWDMKTGNAIDLGIEEAPNLNAGQLINNNKLF